MKFTYSKNIPSVANDSGLSELTRLTSIFHTQYVSGHGHLSARYLSQQENLFWFDKRDI